MQRLDDLQDGTEQIRPLWIAEERENLCGSQSLKFNAGRADTRMAAADTIHLIRRIKTGSRMYEEETMFHLDFWKKFRKTAQKRILPCFCAAALVSSNVWIPVYAQEREITVTDGSQTYKAEVEDRPVSDLLEELSVTLGENDQVNVALTANCEEVTEVVIDRAAHAYVMVDGDAKACYTQGDTVAEFLAEQNIVLGELDVVVPSLDSAVYNGLVVRITRYVVSEEIVSEEIPFTTETRENSELLKGKTRIAVEGEAGVKEYVYKVIYENGVEKSRELIEERIAKEPVTEIKEIGTKKPAEKKNLKVSSVSASLNYKDVIQVKATAYDPSAGTRTATGQRAQVGIIAVDPKVIPLGTKLYVESADGGKSWVYGYCVAGDTGGAIKNNRIDLFFNTNQEARNFGVRQANVYILE